MGVRFRLKASFNISSYPASMKVILTALKKYGMFLADNGSSWYLTGSPSPSWDDNAINSLKKVRGSDFRGHHHRPDHHQLTRCRREIRSRLGGSPAGSVSLRAEESASELV